MKIDSYDVNAKSSHTYVKQESSSLRMSVWNGGNTATIETESEVALVSISDTAKQMVQKAIDSKAGKQGDGTGLSAATAGSKVSGPVTASDPMDMKIKLLEMMISALTGKKYNFRMFDPNKSGSQQLNRPVRATFGGEISAQQTQYEYEEVSYNAKADVKTADGQSISVDISMYMSREFYSHSSINASFGAPQQNLVDPLVINYAGSAASLGDRKYEFDLDVDGKLDNISFAGQGSGFLALDKNGDGKINDGSELFGPQTGSGFGELRTYDKDGNNWIDENDAIYSKLRVWSKDENGNDQLFTLKELDIGAIYLGDVETQFSMNDAENSTNGVMRSTSFFLKDSGGAGLVSHIDLTT